MSWAKDTRLRAGERWRCALKNKEKCRRYREKYPEKIRETNAARNPRRIRFGETYLGIASSPEEAKAVKDHLEPLISDFKTRQKEEYEKHGRFN